MATTRPFHFLHREIYDGMRQASRSEELLLPALHKPFTLTLPIGRLGFWWMVGCALVWAALSLTTLPASAQQSYQIYLPVAGTGAPQGTGETSNRCVLNAEEETVSQMTLTDANQKRTKAVCDPILSQVARARARDMALRGYFAHTNPDGIGPNYLVREAGYVLPDWYSNALGANNIESIAAGYPTANDLWQGWLTSPKHRVHVLGAESFYASQEAYGVGYYYNEDSPMKHYWVFLSAPVEGN